jgi:hypothetical protein
MARKAVAQAPTLADLIFYGRARCIPSCCVTPVTGEKTVDFPLVMTQLRITMLCHMIRHVQQTQDLPTAPHDAEVQESFTEFLHLFLDLPYRNGYVKFTSAAKNGLADDWDRHLRTRRVVTFSATEQSADYLVAYDPASLARYGLPLEIDGFLLEHDGKPTVNGREFRVAKRRCFCYKGITIFWAGAALVDPRATMFTIAVRRFIPAVRDGLLSRLFSLPTEGFETETIHVEVPARLYAAHLAQSQASGKTYSTHRYLAGLHEGMSQFQTSALINAGTRVDIGPAAKSIEYGYIQDVEKAATRGDRDLTLVDFSGEEYKARWRVAAWTVTTKVFFWLMLLLAMYFFLPVLMTSVEGRATNFIATSKAGRDGLGSAHQAATGARHSYASEERLSFRDGVEHFVDALTEGIDPVGTANSIFSVLSSLVTAKYADLTHIFSLDESKEAEADDLGHVSFSTEYMAKHNAKLEAMFPIPDWMPQAGLTDSHNQYCASLVSEINKPSSSFFFKKPYLCRGLNDGTVATNWFGDSILMPSARATLVREDYLFVQRYSSDPAPASQEAAEVRLAGTADVAVEELVNDSPPEQESPKFWNLWWTVIIGVATLVALLFGRGRDPMIR